VSFGERSLQPAFLIDSAARETVSLLKDRLDEFGQPARPPYVLTAPPPADRRWVGRAPNAGFIQFVDVPGLFAVAKQDGITISLIREVGTYCLQGEVIVEAWPKEHVSTLDELTIDEHIQLGKERVPAQDADFGFRRVADIMLKALSPAINDPTTAEYCINRLGELIVLLASGNPDEFNVVSDENGQPRVVLATREFERSVHTAFGQLRFHVGIDTSLMLYSLDIFRRTTALVGPRQQPVILAVADQFVNTVMPTITGSNDRVALESASRWIHEYPANQIDSDPSGPTST